MGGRARRRWGGYLIAGFALQLACGNRDATELKPSAVVGALPEGAAFPPSTAEERAPSGELAEGTSNEPASTGVQTEEAVDVSMGSNPAAPEQGEVRANDAERGEDSPSADVGQELEPPVLPEQPPEPGPEVTLDPGVPNDGTEPLPVHPGDGAGGSSHTGEGDEPSTAGSAGSDLGGEPTPPLPEDDSDEENWEEESPLPGLDARPSAANLALPGTLDVAPPGWLAVEAYPNLTFDDATSYQEAPGTGHIFVTEREGRVWAFPNDPAATSKELVLDLSGQTQGETDCGLLSLVFHPEFGEPDSPNRAYLYVNYAFNPDPIVGRMPDDFTLTYFRLSRFTIDLDTLVIDPSSELILIDQMDEVTWHQGGAMFFHPNDGFLYLTTGDEGGYVCFLQNCQIINRDLYSGVLRIDVDMRGGDISHPIVKQPETGVTANYFIPNDNPFVGQPGVLEEFYALGLRSPHKMTYDPIDNITWIAEVGEVRHEELDVLKAGANYQWNVLEADLPASQVMPTQPIGIWTDPTFFLERQESTAIIGGYVYRGSRFPYLYGKYLFADFVYGNVWALSYNYDGENATVTGLEKLFVAPFRNRNNGIISFGVDLSNELYILLHGPSSKIYRLDRTGGFSNAPRLLSETNVYVDTAAAELQASPGLVPYDVQTPLWSDGAVKRRWISVPNTGFVGFSETAPWTFPIGSVFVKQFDLALDERQPEQVRRLETRVLVHGDDDQYYGLTYKWNSAGTDADLLLESQIEPIDVTLADGQIRDLRYFYPGPADCTVCHNVEAGSVLGPRTQQLNHPMFYPQTGRHSNQVYTWSQLGLLDTPLEPDDIEDLASLVKVTDDSAPLETRVRSYWASNCSMCHGSVTGLRADWNARFEVPLEDQGVIFGPSQSAGVADAFLIVPGDPENSILYRRSSTTDRGFNMPPIGRSAADPDYVRVLREWIRSLGEDGAIEGDGAEKADGGLMREHARSLKLGHADRSSFASGGDGRARFQGARRFHSR